MKRMICTGLLLSLFLVGCAGPEVRQKQFSATFLSLFDTVTTVVGLAESREEFEKTAQDIYDALLIYHRLFDIYREYEGLNNLKTVNSQAGVAPVEVDRAIVELLLDCREYYALTGGKVNVAMGSVLKLWHDARSSGIEDPINAALPERGALERAGEHMDIDCVVIDEKASTVYISDPEARLDVGAVAKGWAVQRVAENAPPGLLISVGGNVCATGAKDESGTPWVIGIQDPDGGEKYLHTICATRGSVVTSGDYQRFYMVKGKPYHHIIDPDTLYPAGDHRSVTVVCADSGLADALSTALFLLPRDQGQALLEKCGAEAMWVCPDGEILYSPGFEKMIRT